MAKRPRRAKVVKNDSWFEKIVNVFKKIFGASVVIFAVVLFVEAQAILEERASNNAGFEHSFVEEIKVENIEVETIEDNFKAITFDNSANYWD